MQALREQSVMSIPHSRAAVDNSVRRNHLLSEEIDQQEWRVAFGAAATQAYGTVKEAALGATALADETFTAIGAFVDGLRDDRSATLELLAKVPQVGKVWLLTKAESTLLMGSRTIACAP